MTDGFYVNEFGSVKHLGSFYEDVKKALEHSIEKHRFILENIESVVSDGGWTTCNLCFLFWELDNCDKCPVRKKTGQRNCEGSPYVKLEELLHEVNPPGERTEEELEKLREAEQAEIDFLEGLLMEMIE